MVDFVSGLTDGQAIFLAFGLAIVTYVGLAVLLSRSFRRGVV